MVHGTTWENRVLLALCHTLRYPADHRRLKTLPSVSRPTALEVSTFVRHLTIVLKLIFQLCQSLQDGLSFLPLLFALAGHDGTMKVIDSSSLSRSALNSHDLQRAGRNIPESQASGL